MGFLDLIWHFSGFAAPAFVLALGMATLPPVLFKSAVTPRPWPQRAAIHFAVGLGISLAGLIITGHDGRMLTYVALALGCGACQAWLTRRA